MLNESIFHENSYFRRRDGLLLPVGLYQHTAVMHPTKPGTILVFGGYAQPVQLSGNGVFSCDLATKTFSRVNIDPTNQATDWPRDLVSAQAVVTHEDKLFVVGGSDYTFTYSYSMEIYQLNLGQQTCRPASTALPARQESRCREVATSSPSGRTNCFCWAESTSLMCSG